ncbi:MAG: serine hydrolase domain-containing protein [Cyclobacteriaceae bacterium]|nr:beta-lactamase family protein [Cyclobacteriaceae bacterium]
MSRLIIALLVIASAVASAQNKSQVVEGMSTERLARIDVRMQQAIKDNWFPGAVVLIIRNGKPVYFKSFGKSDLEASTDMKKDNIFRIASQTKAITSLAVMMLFEEGKFQLDDPVSKFIPEFKNSQVLTEFNANDSTYKSTPAKKEITIRHLLTHTSGISYAAIGSSEFNAIYAKASVPSGIGTAFATLGDKMKILGGLPIKHLPGESFTYGLNIDVLGYLVEIWSGQTLSNFFESRIFRPLGMNDTYFYLPVEKHSRLVPVYEEVNGKLSKVTHQIYDKVDPWYPRLKGQYYSGGAGLSSTVEDYSKFLQLFLNKGEYNGKRLLSRKTVELMLTNQTGAMSTQFGLGFELETALNDYQDPTSIGTFSWGGAFNTTYWADPKENLVALLYTQIYQSPHREIGSLFKALTYQAIVD